MFFIVDFKDFGYNLMNGIWFIFGYFLFEVFINECFGGFKFWFKSYVFVDCYFDYFCVVYGFEGYIVFFIIYGDVVVWKYYVVVVVYFS